MSTKESLTYLELHRTLATLMMKNRFIRKLTHTGLSRADIHILIELEAFGEATVKTLQPILGIDQSTVSRLVKNLLKRKLIIATKPQRDKRAKPLAVTALGEKTIAQIDEVAGKVFEQFASRLTESEKSELLEFFQRVADWYGQPSCPLRRGESGVRMQQRRMSRALGVLSQNVFGSGLPSSHWFVFREICYAAYPLNSKSLSQHQGIPANTLSIILEKLENMGLVKRDYALHDSRYIELSPLAKGRKQLDITERQCADDLMQILSDYSRERLNSLLDIMQRYIDQDSTKSPILLPAGFTLRQIKSKKERDMARSFAVVELVQRGHAEFMPATFIGPDSIVFTLLDESEKLQAVCEIQIGSTGAEVSLLASTKNTTPNLAYLFMERVFEQLRESGKVKALTFSFEPAARLLQKAGVLGAERRMLIR